MSGFFRAIRRFFRFVITTAISLAVILSLLLAGAVVYRKPVAEFLIVQTLAFYGFPESHVSIDEISARRLAMSDLRLGRSDGSLKTFHVSYELPELLKGRLQSVSVDGVRLEADLAKLEAEGQQRTNLDRVITLILNSDAVVTVGDVIVVLRNSPVGNVELHASGNANFLGSPASFELQFSAVPLDEGSPLVAFAFSGNGSATSNGIDFSGPTHVSFSDGHLGGWAVDRLEYDDEAELQIVGRSARFRLAAPIDLRVRQVQPEEGNDETASQDMLAFNLKTGVAQISANWQSGFSGSAEITGGGIDIEVWNLKASGIGLKIPFEGAELAETSVVSARLTDTAQPTRFSPQLIDASFHQDEEEFVMQLSASPEGTGARLTMSGRYNTLSGEGSIDIGPDALHFSKDGLQPANISPLLSSFGNTTGVVRVSGSVRIFPDRPIESNAVLTLKDIDTDLTVLSFDDLSGTLNIIDLFNPRTPPGQVFEARAMTAPVPLEKPTLSLHWVRTGDDPLIRIEKAEGGFAGGMIRVKETSFRLAANENEITLVFDRLSLKTLFEEWAGGRVSGDGVLSGEIPVTLTLDGPIITDGELAAVSGGFIKVHWGDARESLEAQGNEVALMVQALDNFQYKVLKAGVRRPSNGELVLLVQLEGANPEVLDGYPFRVNVNLSGDLEDVLAAFAEGQSLTQDLLRARMNDGN